MNVDKRFKKKKFEPKVLNIKYVVDKDLKIKEARDMAERLVKEYLEKKFLTLFDLSTEDKHYIYIPGPTVSDLTVLEINKLKVMSKKFPGKTHTTIYRSCNSNEWSHYYYKYLAGSKCSRLDYTNK